MSTQTLECRGCGRVLPPDAPHELCPACLLRAGLETNGDGDVGSFRGASFIPSPANELSDRIAGLQVFELIGRGGMGAVYRARQVSLDRPAAVKLLSPALSTDQLFAERFEREAKAVARLAHQHLVNVYDFGRAGEFFYIVMELVDGPNLRQRLCQSPALSTEQALELGGEICSALDYAHEEGIVHRDVKPENILLDAKGRAKIADFGLARLLGTAPRASATLTYTSVSMGTPVYMAPEQLASSNVGPRADIYAAGIVLYEMLTGKLPLGHFEAPSRSCGGDTRIDAVIRKALAQDPEHRYATAGEMRSDIEQIRRRMVVPDYAILGTRWSRGKIWRAVRLASEMAVCVAAFALLVPLWTGIRIGWRNLVQPVTFFNATEPLFGWVWLGYFGLLLLLAMPFLLLRFWFRNRLSFAAACAVVLAVAASAGYRLVANPRVNAFQLPGMTGHVYYDQGNRLLVARGNGQIHAYDPTGNSSAGQVDGKFSGGEYIRTNAQRTRMIVTRKDGVLELLDPTANTYIAAIRGPNKAELQGAFSPDGARIAVLVPAAYDSAAKQWKRDGDSSLWIVSAVDGSVLSKEPTPPLSNAWQSIDWVGDFVAAGDCYHDNGRGVMLYDVAQHRMAHNLVHPEFQAGPLSVKLSPDAKTLAVGYAPWDVALWDTSSGQIRHKLESRNNWVVCLDFSPDGKLLASGEGDSAVRVWDVATGRQLRHFGTGSQNSSNYTYSVSFLPTGGLLACGTADAHVVVWKVPESHP